MTKPAALRLTLPPEIDTQHLFGHLDANLRLVEEAFSVRVTARGNELVIHGPARAARTAERVLSSLAAAVQDGMNLRPEEVRYAIQAAQDHPEMSIKGLFDEGIPVPSHKRFIIPKTPTQRQYIEAIRKSDLVLGIGPAGTGKTYLAMAMAVLALTRHEVTRIILARPAVEAGEKLGFLPGDMYAKVNPYLRPLIDALYDMMEVDRANRLVERGEIEIAPLAYMRGRTLNDSFIILDEAQNATSEQMKMFVTRLGFNSKAVITGDVTQVDLPSDRTSGLIEIQDILGGIPEIRFVYFNEQDVVRHRLVQEIIKAYDRYEDRRGKAKRR